MLSDKKTHADETHNEIKQGIALHGHRTCDDINILYKAVE